MEGFNKRIWNIFQLARLVWKILQLQQQCQRMQLWTKMQFLVIVWNLGPFL